MLKFFVLFCVFAASSDGFCGKKSLSQKLIDESALKVLSVRTNTGSNPFAEVDDAHLRLKAQNGSALAQDELIRRWSEGLIEIDPSRDLMQVNISALKLKDLRSKPGYMFLFIKYYADIYPKIGNNLFNWLQAEYLTGKSNSETNYSLGLMHYLGRCTFQSSKMAKVHLDLASKLGHPKAKIILGEMIFDKNDMSKAEPYYREAADLGDLSGKYRLAQIYKHLGKYEDAFQLYLEAAKGGYARAAFDIGHNYLDGAGCDQNIEEGIKWLRIASGKGLNKAMYNLAVIYYRGERVEKNIHEALEWTLNSVAYGSKEGRALLARLSPLKRIQERLRSINSRSKMELLIEVQALRISAPTPYLRSYFKMAYKYVYLLDALKPGFMVTNIQPIEEVLIGPAPHDQAITWQTIEGKTYYTVGRQNCALQKIVLAYRDALLSENDNFEKHVKELKESASEFKEAQRRLTELLDVYNPLTGVLIRNREYSDFAVELAY